MIAGFTGTRYETTGNQHESLCNWLRENKPTELHHGCCTGADEEVVIATQAILPQCSIIGHPPVNTRSVSREAVQGSHSTRNPKPYLDRNKDIVACSDVLLACPKGDEEFSGSGTWATIRAARRTRKPIVIFWPDGSIRYENR